MLAASSASSPSLDFIATAGWIERNDTTAVGSDEFA
jgi:hypothetical protein